MKQHVIYVQWTNNFGGLEKITCDYERYITKYSPKVLILKYNINGIKYKNEIRFRIKKPTIFLYLLYIQKVWKFRNSIFHLNNATLKILLATYIAGGRKIVYHFHGTRFPSDIFQRVVWKFFHKKINIIGNSNYVNTLINNKLKISEKLYLIPNLIDIEHFKFHTRQKHHPFIITYAGRFTVGKNIDKIIQIAKILQGVDNNITFKLYGEGPEKDEIKRLVELYNLHDSVNIYGFSENIFEVYKESNLFLFLSSHESFGNVVAEAIFSGTPVLCLKIPALEDLIKDNSFFVNTLDTKIIAKEILRFINDYDEVNLRLANVHDSLKKYLDNNSIIKRLESLYKTLL